jgi:hypothetical protein
MEIEFFYSANARYESEPLWRMTMSGPSTRPGLSCRMNCFAPSGRTSGPSCICSALRSAALLGLGYVGHADLVHLHLQLASSTMHGVGNDGAEIHAESVGEAALPRASLRHRRCSIQRSPSSLGRPCAAAGRRTG